MEFFALDTTTMGSWVTGVHKIRAVLFQWAWIQVDIRLGVIFLVACTSMSLALVPMLVQCVLSFLVILIESTQPDDWTRTKPKKLVRGSFLQLKLGLFSDTLGPATVCFWYIIEALCEWLILLLQIAGISVKSLTAGSAHTCGLASDGILWCWGENIYGQLGIGRTSGWNTPAAVDFGAGIGWSRRR